MTPPELRALLADSLVLWNVSARVAIDGEGAALTAPDGTPLRILPASAEERPIRWWIERPDQRRPCTSVLGLLRGLRNAVGAGDGVDARSFRVAVPDGG